MTTNEAKEEVKEDVTFSSLGLCPELCEACTKIGWKSPSMIQEQSLPYSLKGRDIIGLAETGSGKTGAFVLPVLQSLFRNPQKIFALFVAPARELAFQISAQVEALGSIIGVKCVTLTGGIDMAAQSSALLRKPHCIVGTPGRIVDHLESTKGFHLRTLKFLILDEADKLLSMDFEEQLNTILAACPRERNTYLFSATMTSKVEKLQRASLTNPVKVEVSKKYQTVGTLKEHFLLVPSKFKDCYLAYLINEFSGNSIIVFVRTCKDASRISILLRNLGFSAVPLHGQIPQAKRLGALSKFKTGSHSILIATDVASRGLDIPAVDYVLNYDVPGNSDDYIHRVGRTARAGRAGHAITFVSQYDVEIFQRIEAATSKRLTPYPTEEKTVLLLLERVTEAQRIAAIEMRELEQQQKRSKRKQFEEDETEEKEERSIYDKFENKKPKKQKTEKNKKK